MTWVYSVAEKPATEERSPTIKHRRRLLYGMFVDNTKTTSYNQDRHPPDVNVRGSPAHLEKLNNDGKEREGIAMRSQDISLSTPLVDYLGFWMASYKLNSVKPSTLSRLETSISTLRTYPIAYMPIGDINADHIQEYVNQVTARGYAATTIKKLMHIVTSPLRHAAALHRIRADPSQGVILPNAAQVKKPAKKIEAYTDEEQKKLREVLRSQAREGYVAIEIMLETGMRVGETLALDWKNVQLGRKAVRVEATVINLLSKKNAKVQHGAKSESSNRTLPLSTRAMELLTELRSKSDGPWVFSGKDGERLTYEALLYHVKRAVEEAGVPYKGLHIFRHTFATNCYYRDCNVKILSKLLGHANVNITYNTYIHLFGDALEEMRAIVG